MPSGKLTRFAFALALLLGAGLGRAATTVSSFADIQNWVGSGPNQAALVIDWEDGKNLSGSLSGQALAWGYRWSDGQNPTGLDMIKAVAAADPRLDISIVVRGNGSGTTGETVFGLFYDLDGDGGTATFQPVTEDGSASDPDDHFAEGWFANGYWSYFRGATNGSTLPAWTVSGSGAQGRALVNGAWDGWTFDDFSSSTSPKPGTAAAAAAVVPEPNAFLLLALGGLALYRRR